MRAKGWQEFVNAMAERARDREYRRNRDTVANGLWTLVAVAVITFAVGSFFKWMGWL